MATFDDILARWQASLSSRLPPAAVAHFLAEEGPELRQAFERATSSARERRSARAFHQWLDRQALAGRDFDETQLRWLDMMRQDITAAGELSIDRLNHGPFLARGGEDRAVRLFGRRTLGEVVASLNAAFAPRVTACAGGCGCGGTCGVKAGCGCKRPKPAPAQEVSTAQEVNATTVEQVLRAAGLELTGRVRALASFTIYQTRSAEERSRALSALAQAGVPAKFHHDSVVVRHRPLWS